MINSLIDNYGDLHDAIIQDIQYNSNFDFSKIKVVPNEESIEITIKCFDYNIVSRDLIKIYCKDIQYFNLKEYDMPIYQALIEENESGITLDFFPELCGNPNGEGVISKENLRSDCIIKCKNLYYEVIAYKI